MVPNWRDHRPVTAACSLCGAGVQTTLQLRGRIYCLECRETRRRESAERANQRFRMKRRISRGKQPLQSALPVTWGKLSAPRAWLQRRLDVVGKVGHA